MQFLSSSVIWQVTTEGPTHTWSPPCRISEMSKPQIPMSASWVMIEWGCLPMSVTEYFLPLTSTVLDRRPKRFWLPSICKASPRHLASKYPALDITEHFVKYLTELVVYGFFLDGFLIFFMKCTTYMRFLMPVNWDLGLALKNSWELGLFSQNYLELFRIREYSAGIANI